MARQDGGGFLAGLILGALVGLALALLYPASARVAGLPRLPALGAGSAEGRFARSQEELRARFRPARD